MKILSNEERIQKEKQDQKKITKDLIFLAVAMFVLLAIIWGMMGGPIPCSGSLHAISDHIRQVNCFPRN